MNDLKPLTQEEVEEVNSRYDNPLPGWTADGGGMRILSHGYFFHPASLPYIAITKLVRALLSAEQEERHPLFCGYVEIKGVKRELRTRLPIANDGFYHCPGCDFTFTSDPCEKCGWGFFAREGDVMRAGGDYTLWIAPAPAPKEPEMDEFEKWASKELEHYNGCERQKAVRAALEKYQEAVTRKGEQDGK